MFKVQRLFQRFYLLLLGCLLLYLALGMSVRHGIPGLGMLDGTLLLIALAMLISAAAYPLARRLSARLERLNQAVAAFGRGQLQQRAVVEGHDEVAALARGFNDAAERIEHSMLAHRALLANASHELRTPLARIRLGVALIAKEAEAPRRGELIQDLRELDDLLEEILLSSRLESALPLNIERGIDPLALLAEEAARYAELGIDLQGPAGLRLDADRKLLRRLIRNLLENARRHGAPPVRVTLSANESLIRLQVEDAGPGIPDADQGRVFQPFFRSRAQQENIGSGLGLALVRQIAERHGGSAGCGNCAAGGAQLWVELPVKLDGGLAE